MAYVTLPKLFIFMLIRHRIIYIKYKDNLLIGIDDFYKLYEKESQLLTQLELKFRSILNYSQSIQLTPLQNELTEKFSHKFYSVFAEQQKLMNDLWNLLDIQNIMIKDQYNNYIPLWTETYIKWINRLREQQIHQ